MEVSKTKLDGCLLFKPNIYHDQRGFFLQGYEKRFYQQAGLPFEFVQDNLSYSKKGVLRGLHLQIAPYAQGKLVSVAWGKVLDVAVDLRLDSPTFAQWVAYELSSENAHQLYVPRGFAHGFLALSEVAILTYKCDNYYHPASECSLKADDPRLAIEWPLSPQEAIVSSKDRSALSLEEYKALLKTLPSQS